MTKKIISLFFLFFFFGTVFAQSFPQPDGYVTDLTGVLSSTEPALEQRLTALEKESTVEVAILFVSSLGGLEPAEYAQSVFDQWKIGKAGNDNGLLILVAVDDHTFFIQTGYGLEGVLPDIVLGRMGRDILVPAFQEENYTGGIDALLDAIEGYVSGNPEVVDTYNPPPLEFELFNTGFLMGIVSLLLLIGLLLRDWLSLATEEKRTTFLARDVAFLFGTSMFVGLGTSLFTLFAFNGWYGFTILSVVYGYFLVFGPFPLAGKNFTTGASIGSGIGRGRWGGGFGGFGGSSGKSGGFGGFGGGMSGGGGAGGSW